MENSSENYVLTYIMTPSLQKKYRHTITVQVKNVILNLFSQSFVSTK